MTIGVPVCPECGMPMKQLGPDAWVGTHCTHGTSKPNRSITAEQAAAIEAVVDELEDAPDDGTHVALRSETADALRAAMGRDGA
jgi:hypothetical protein